MGAPASTSRAGSVAKKHRRRSAGVSDKGISREDTHDQPAASSSAEAASLTAAKVAGDTPAGSPIVRDCHLRSGLALRLHCPGTSCRLLAAALLLQDQITRAHSTSKSSQTRSKYRVIACRCCSQPVPSVEGESHVCDRL